jgi:hypothetical protein
MPPKKQMKESDEPKTVTDIENAKPAPEVIVQKPQAITRTQESDIPYSREIVPVTTFFAPLVSVEDASRAFEHYQALISALMKQSDVVLIQGRQVAKKSGINKLARFFGISVEVIKEKQEMYPGPKGGTVFIAKTWAKAIAPNGQFRVAGAACSSSERRFNHVYSDVMGTSETRAKKRAIEELIGMGSLELMGDMPGTQPEEQDKVEETHSEEV